MKFILFRRLTLRGWRWYWHLKARNGEIVAQSEGYSRQVDAMVSIELVRDLRADTPIRIDGP